MTTTTLDRDQMDTARAAMLARVISRLMYRRYVARLPDSLEAHKERDFCSRDIAADMLDLTADELAEALDALDKHPAINAMTPETQARWILARLIRD